MRLTPSDAGGPGMLEDGFAKIMFVDIEKLEAEAAAIRRRLVGSTARNAAALVTVEYVLRFCERADRGEEGLRRFGRYSFLEELAQANAILDDLEQGRDPFRGRHGDFHRAYRSA